MTLHRPDWDDYFLIIARSVSARADCRRARHGAVIVSTDHRIVSTGYNGSAPGGPSCLEGACTRGHLLESQVAHNQADYSNCIALHAEQNAIAFADHRDTVGATLYITGTPCDMCAKLVAAAGIVRIVVENAREAVRA